MTNNSKEINMKNSEKNILKIATNKGKEQIDKAGIVCCKQFSFGTSVSLHNGKHLLLQESIAELRTVLDSESFFVVDEDTLINLKYVDAVLPNYLVMSTGEQFGVTERQRNAFFKRVNKFFELEYNS